MANHNELKKFSTTPQANTAVYSDENGYISDWLNNDPVIAALKQENEFIGSVPTAPAPDTQSILTQFVVDTTGRAPRNGDEVAIEDVGELWIFNGTEWVFFTTTVLQDATTTSKGVMQVGSGLLVNNGLVSVNSSIYTPSRETISSTSITPSIALLASKDYVFSNNLTSLTLTSIPNSPYYTTITFTPAAGFTLTAAGLSQYFYYTTPTFISGRTYRLTIVDGRCYIDYTGARIYPINKLVATNPVLTPTDGIVTWSVTNTLATSEIILRVIEIATGATVAVDSAVSASTITIAFNADTTVAANTYKIIAIG